MMGVSEDVPHSKLEISVKCLNLPNMDLLSKSDPFYTFYLKNNKCDADWIHIKTSETIPNNNNPVFSEKIYLTYLFESYQVGKIEIFDSDNGGLKKDYIGYFEFSIGQLLSNREMQQPQKLLRNENNPLSMATIILHAEEISGTSANLDLRIQVVNVPKAGFIFKSNRSVKLEFYRPCDGNVDKLSHRTNVQTSHIWDISVQLFNLCSGELDNQLKLNIVGSSNGHLYGSTSFTGNMIHQAYNNNNDKKFQLQVFDESRQKLKNMSILFTVKSIKPTFSFCQFIRSGMQINFITCVDFTYSNGYPATNVDSLHNISQSTNPYSTAISAVGSILLEYDYDKFVTCYGFGARLFQNAPADHCFNLRPDGSQCFGIDGVLQAYYERVTSVQFYGPTNFAPSISRAAKEAQENHTINLEYAEFYRRGNVFKGTGIDTNSPLLQYVILLIITDGEISDFELTIQEIVDASYLPLSIIIVGVGNADFSAMEFLDGDEKILEYKNKRACRDIVQFVPLSQHLDFNNSWNTVQAALASSVLAEIPQQVTSYMTMHKIEPVKIVN